MMRRYVFHEENYNNDFLKFNQSSKIIHFFPKGANIVDETGRILLWNLHSIQYINEDEWIQNNI